MVLGNRFAAIRVCTHRFWLHLSVGILAVVVFFLICSTKALASPPSGDYMLVPEVGDEFNDSSVDMAKWNYRLGNRYFSTNRSENVTTVEDPEQPANRLLSIQFKKEDPASNDGYPYSSGGIYSKALLGFGYYEIRAKLWADGPGLHMSFWNYGTNYSASLPIRNSVNEIDMFEIDSHDPTRLATNLHYYAPALYDPPGHGQSVTVSDPSDSYHIYGFEWLPDKVIWYVDGVAVRTAAYAGPLGMQNLWLTAQQSSGDPNEVDDSVLPGSMLVDYFRYYQTSDSPVLQAPLQSIILNNGSTGYTESADDWSSLDNVAFGYEDRSIRYTANTDAWARWTPDLPATGQYDVYFWNPSYYEEPLPEAQITVSHNGTTDLITVDQSTAGQNWVHLGTFDFLAGTGHYVQASKPGSGSGVLRVDSVMFVPVTSLVDDEDPVRFTEESGVWNETYTPSGWNDSASSRSASPGAAATWKPDPAASGPHDLYVWLPIDSGNTTAAEYTISHNGVIDSVYRDQSQGTSRWTKLGTYFFASGSTDFITVENSSGTGNLAADAIKLIPAAAVDSTPPSAPSGITVTPSSDESAGNHKLSVTWNPNTETDVAGYNFYISGTRINSNVLKSTQYRLEQLLAGTAYTIGVSAIDNSGNESEVTTVAASTLTDSTAPAIPVGTLTAVPGASESIFLKVTPSTANKELDFAGYYYYANGIKLNPTPRSGSYTASGLTNGTSYLFTVSGVDRSGNETSLSEMSAEARPVEQTIVEYGSLQFRDIAYGGGVWNRSSVTPFSARTAASNTTGSWFEWHPSLSDRTYEVFAYVPYHTTGTASASYTVYSAEATPRTLTISQQGTESRWVSLGQYTFTGTATDKVRLENAAASGYLRANAVKFVPLEIDFGDWRYTEPAGVWTSSSNVMGWDGTGSRFTNTPGASAQWQPELTEGVYDIYAWIPNHSNSTTQARYTITHNGKTDTVIKDQTTGGNQWVPIGTYDFASGTDGHVKLDNALTTGYLRSDALRFLFKGPLTVTVDNDDADYAESGTWSASGLKGYNDSSTRYSGSSASYARWSPDLPLAGTYTVLFYNVVHAYNDPNAQVTVSHSGGTSSITVDQVSGNAGWVNLGSYTFDPSEDPYVQLTNTGDGYVRSDAIQFVLQ